LNTYDRNLDKTLWVSDWISLKRGAAIKAQIKRYGDGKPKLCIIEWGRDPKSRRQYTVQFMQRMDAETFDAGYRVMQEGRDALEDFTSEKA
jgi:hypothetical protein